MFIVYGWLHRCDQVIGSSTGMGKDQASINISLLLFLYVFNWTNLYRRTLKACLIFEVLWNNAKVVDGVEELSNTITTHTLSTCIGEGAK